MIIITAHLIQLIWRKQDINRKEKERVSRIDWRSIQREAITNQDYAFASDLGENALAFPATYTPAQGGGCEDMNTALKLGETTSFQNSNTQDKGNLHIINRELVPFHLGAGTIRKKEGKK